MDSTSTWDNVKEALRLIESIKLPHPYGALLHSFILNAVNPLLAAQYVLDACQHPHEEAIDRQTEALHLVIRWTKIVESISKYGCPPPMPDAATRAAIIKRDGGQCCITGKAGSLWDPLVVIPILRVPSRWIREELELTGMLNAFFTTRYSHQWLNYIRQPERMDPSRNHWLVRKSAARAFGQGLVKLVSLQQSNVEYEVRQVSIGPTDRIDLNGFYALLGDRSRQNIKRVDPQFVWTHARLAQSIQYVNLAQQIGQNNHTGAFTSMGGSSLSNSYTRIAQRIPLFIPDMIKTTCLVIWLKFPARMRLAVYKGLSKIGSRRYGNIHGLSVVQRLPFGLYLKYAGDPEKLRNEFNALKMVHQHTSVPVPKPLDLIIVASEEIEPPYSHDVYLLTSRIPGFPLSECQNVMSDKDGAEYVAQMQAYIAQIRSIPKTVSPEYAICNTLGEALRDYRIQGAAPVGPFVDEEAFSQVLLNPDEPSRRGHQIVFTHADLNARNIIVDRFKRPDGTLGWKVTGIVDWENAGFYPAYWDYTKMLFEGFRYTLRWRTLMHRIFRPFGDLSREFEVEERSWREAHMWFNRR